MMHLMNGFGFAGMFVWMLLQWGLLLVGVYFLIRWIRGDKDQVEDPALHILRERFAKGEISEEEFVHMKKILDPFSERWFCETSNPRTRP